MSIIGGTAANLGGAIVPTVVSLVTIPLYIHLIGQERYGVLVLIWLLVGYFRLFEGGLGSATAQRIAALAAASGEARARVFWTALLLNGSFGLLGGIVLWFVVGAALEEWGGLSPDLLLEIL